MNANNTLTVMEKVELDRELEKLGPAPCMADFEDFRDWDFYMGRWDDNVEHITAKILAKREESPYELEEF